MGFEKLWTFVLVRLTQRRLDTMVAGPAPDDFRGTAYGLFNFVGGLATPFASVLTGMLWETFGSAATFYAGVHFAPRRFCCWARAASRHRLLEPYLSQTEDRSLVRNRIYSCHPSAARRRTATAPQDPTVHFAVTQPWT